MLPPKCHLELQCEEVQSLTIQDLVEPINYGLQRPPLQVDICSPLDLTPVSLLECEDSWRKAKEDWFTTRFSYGRPSPFAEPSCPPPSPVHISSQADQPQPEITSGRKKRESETPLSGDAPCHQEEIPRRIGNQFVGVPKEELLNLSLQMCTFDVIIRSEELAQIMYNLIAERLSVRYF
jgi:hypothetical protein